MKRSSFGKVVMRFVGVATGITFMISCGEKGDGDLSIGSPEVAVAEEGSIDAKDVFFDVSEMSEITVGNLQTAIQAIDSLSGCGRQPSQLRRFRLEYGHGGWSTPLPITSCRGTLALPDPFERS